MVQRFEPVPASEIQVGDTIEHPLLAAPMKVIGIDDSLRGRRKLRGERLRRELLLREDDEVGRAYESD